MLENLTRIKVQNPVDIITSKIRELIISETLKPGDKLPPERKLAESFGVSRSQVREAIIKLQFYGMVKVMPQSGTVVSGVGINALQGMLTDILKIEKSDFRSLVDTRILLEKEAARLAAIHRTDDDILAIKEALKNYETKLSIEEHAVEEDLMFHVRIAEASGNSVLKAMMLIITPEIVTNIIDLKVCSESNNRKTINEHKDILDMIIAKEPEGAFNAMESHLSEIRNFNKQFSETI